MGAALFAGSLGCFAYFHTVVLDRAGAGGAASPAAASAWNIALFTVFALHHSLLARNAVRAAMARVVPAGLERSAYVWVASLLFIGVCLLWQPLPGVAWEVDGPARGLLFAVQVAGIVLTLRSAAIIDIRELAGIRQAAREADTSDERDRPVIFKTTGPYGWLRHPIYLGWVLIVFGAPRMTAGRLLFAAVSTLYLIAAIPLEERSLVQAHGAAYRHYRQQVRWRLIPGVW